MSVISYIVRGIFLGMIGMGLSNMGYTPKTLTWWLIIVGLGFYVNLMR